ncbi:hypothetical protein G6F46_015038 [Rhizopus delemar]|nr:hypothetical protein G6F46_015038 [Rhizopus delemar]
MVGGQHKLAVHVRDLAGLRMFQHLDALQAKRHRHGFADGRVFAKAQRAARQDRDLGPKPGEGLRQLNSHYR